MTQARYWLLTIPKDAYQPPAELPAQLSFLKGQQEIGDNTNYHHWQCVCAFKRAVRLAAVKSLFGQQCHAEPSRSSAANDYVFKV
jgi:hypothetical protein